MGVSGPLDPTPEARPLLVDPVPAPSLALRVRRLGVVPYARSWEAMRRWTDRRDAASLDEVWLLQHPAVFTLGQGGRREHLHDPGPIPVVPTDRGGQITYHGPGQLIAYLLFDLPRRGIGVRRFVELIEQSVIELLRGVGIAGERVPGAPGVYVGGRKVAALGLRIRRGRTYHGLALNVDVDLGPFARIDPCGYRGLQVTRLSDLGVPWGTAEAGERWLAAWRERLAAERTA
jgi:lipoyl(octanoyl) transferase